MIEELYTLISLAVVQDESGLVGKAEWIMKPYPVSDKEGLLADIRALADKGYVGIGTAVGMPFLRLDEWSFEAPLTAGRHWTFAVTKNSALVGKNVPEGRLS
jgi:hypothetical protein